jgi:hypothetical protein
MSHFAVWFVIISCQMLNLGNQSTELSTETTLKEVRKGIKQLEKMEASVTSYLCTDEGTAPNNKYLRKYQVNQKANDLLISFDRYKVCVTGSLCFAAKNQLNSNNWILERHDPNGGRLALMKIIDNCDFVLHPLTTMNDQRIAEILDSSNFRASNAFRLSTGEVELKYTIEENGDTITGVITMDPRLHYLVTKAQTTTNLKKAGLLATTSFSRAILESTNGIQFGNIITETKEEKIGFVMNKRNFTFKSTPEIQADPAEYTLAHYNITIPDYDVYEDRPQTNWFLWGCIGIACLVLSVVLAWYAHRRNRNVSGG